MSLLSFTNWSNIQTMRLPPGIRAAVFADILEAGYGFAAQSVVPLVCQIYQIDYLRPAGLPAEGVQESEKRRSQPGVLVLRHLSYPDQ